jgi:hypothetical protein
LKCGQDNRNCAAAINAGVNSIATQGVMVAAGLQERFSWKSVAASAVAADVTNQLSNSILGEMNYDSSGNAVGRTATTPADNNLAARFVIGLIRGFIGAYIRHGITDNEINVRDVAADSVGNTLADEIVGRLIRKEQNSKRLAEQQYGLSNAIRMEFGLRKQDATNCGRSIRSMARISIRQITT